MGRQEWRQSWRYVGWTFLLSWALIGLFTLLVPRPGPALVSGITMVYMFMPMIVAIILRKGVEKGSVKELGLILRPNRYFIVAWLLPVLLVLLSVGINLLFPQVEYAPEMTGFFEQLEGKLSAEQVAQLESQLSTTIHPFWLGLLQGLIAGCTINALFAFGEELGWRGYLLHACQKLGFWKASLFIGIVWGLWHAPIILLYGHNYPDHRLSGVGMMVIFCVLFSVLHTYIRVKSGSVIAASIFHGTINGLFGLPLLVIQGGNDLINGAVGLSGCLAALVVILVILLLHQRLRGESLAQRFQQANL